MQWTVSEMGKQTLLPTSPFHGGSVSDDHEVQHLSMPTTICHVQCSILGPVPAPLTPTAVAASLTDCFAEWSASTGLSFKQTDSEENANVVVQWASKSTNVNFDGAGGTLAESTCATRTMRRYSSEFYCVCVDDVANRHCQINHVRLRRKVVAGSLREIWDVQPTCSGPA